MIVSFKMPQNIYLDANDQYIISWTGLLGYKFSIFTVYYKYHDSSVWNNVQYMPKPEPNLNNEFNLSDMINTFKIGDNSLKDFKEIDYKIDTEFTYMDVTGNILTGHETSDTCVVIFKNTEIGILKAYNEDTYYSEKSDEDLNFGDLDEPEIEPVQHDWDFNEDIQDERFIYQCTLDLNLGMAGAREAGYPVFTNVKDNKYSLRVKLDDNTIGNVPMVSNNSPLAGDAKINHNGVSRPLAKDEPEFHYNTPVGYGGGYVSKYYQTYQDMYQRMYYIKYSRETFYQYEPVYEKVQIYRPTPSYSYYNTYGSYNTYTGPHYQDYTFSAKVNAARYYRYNASLVEIGYETTSTPQNKFVYPEDELKEWVTYMNEPITYLPNSSYVYVYNAVYSDNLYAAEKNVTYYITNDTGYYYYYGYNNILYSQMVPKSYGYNIYNEVGYGNLPQQYIEKYTYYNNTYTYAQNGSYAYATFYTAQYAYYYYTTYSYETLIAYKYYGYNASYYYYKNNLYYTTDYRYNPVYKYYTYGIPQYRKDVRTLYNPLTYYYGRYTVGLQGYYMYYYIGFSYYLIPNLYNYIASYSYTYYYSYGSGYYNYNSQPIPYKYYPYVLSYGSYRYSYNTRHDYSYRTSVARYAYRYGASYRYQNGYYWDIGYSRYAYTLFHYAYNPSTRRKYSYYTTYAYYISFYYARAKYETRADRYSYISGYTYRTETYTYYTKDYATVYYADQYAMRPEKYYYYRSSAQYNYSYSMARPLVNYRYGYYTSYGGYYWTGSSAGLYYYYYTYNSSTPTVGSYYTYYQDTSYYYYYTAYSTAVNYYYAYVTGYRNAYNYTLEYQARINYDKTTYNYTYYRTNSRNNNGQYTYYTTSPVLYMYNIYYYAVLSYTTKIEGYNYKYRYYYGSYNYNYRYYSYVTTYGPAYGYNSVQYNTIAPYTYNYKYHKVVGYYENDIVPKMIYGYIVPKYITSGQSEAWITPNYYYYYMSNVYEYTRPIYLYYNIIPVTEVVYYDYSISYGERFSYYQYNGPSYYISGYASKLDYYYQTFVGYEDQLNYYYAYITGYFDHNEGVHSYSQYSYTAAIGHIEEYSYKGSNIYLYKYNYEGYYYTTYKQYYSNYSVPTEYYYTKYDVMYVNKAYKYLDGSVYKFNTTKEGKYIPIIQSNTMYSNLSLYKGIYTGYENKNSYAKGSYVAYDASNNAYIAYYTARFTYQIKSNLYYNRTELVDHFIVTEPKKYVTEKYVNDGIL